MGAGCAGWGARLGALNKGCRGGTAQRSAHVSAPSDVAMVRMLASKRGEVSGEPWA